MCIGVLSQHLETMAIWYWLNGYLSLNMCRIDILDLEDRFLLVAMDHLKAGKEKRNGLHQVSVLFICSNYFMMKLLKS